jgi:hypothetical protein
MRAQDCLRWSSLSHKILARRDVDEGSFIEHDQSMKALAGSKEESINR